MKMNESSLAAQAVASGPGTVAPPSFDGHGWLVALNIGTMTFAQVSALGKMLLDRAVAPGGRFHRDTFTDPAGYS